MRAVLQISVSFVFALAAAPTLHSEENGQPAKAPTDPVHSRLYRGFDPDILEKKCNPHFDHVGGGGVRSGLQFGPALAADAEGDWYKLFDIEGTISEDKLKQLLEVLKLDLHKMAKASGVEEVGQPSDRIEDRPISLVRAMYHGRKIRPGSLHGFHLTYSDGTITGAIDVLAALSSDPIDNNWEVVCAVHELLPEDKVRSLTFDDRYAKVVAGMLKLKEAEVVALLGPAHIMKRPAPNEKGQLVAELELGWEFTTRVIVEYQDGKVSSASGVFSEQLPVERVTPNAFRRVRLGQTRKEVVEILGDTESTVPSANGVGDQWGATWSIKLGFDKVGILVRQQRSGRIHAPRQ